MEDAFKAGCFDAPTSNVQALAILMRDWLRAFAADGGGGVDSGMGSQQCDLWVQFGGEEMFISIRHSDRQRRRDFKGVGDGIPPPQEPDDE